MIEPAFQDRVDWQCYGCGRLNDHGLQIKSYWHGDEIVCAWRPEPYHVGHPGRLQGGVIATIAICHGVWAATAAAHKQEGRELREPLDFTYSTTALKLDLVKPVPIDCVLTFRAKVSDMHDGRATVSCSVLVGGEEHARAETEHVRVRLSG
ncbi:MAG TPA: PaaI family thioesterase [bacterium]|nr:PaaI family thioesterase [bacterium]